MKTEMENKYDKIKEVEQNAKEEKQQLLRDKKELTELQDTLKVEVALSVSPLAQAIGVRLREGEAEVPETQAVQRLVQAGKAGGKQREGDLQLQVVHPGKVQGHELQGQPDDLSGHAGLAQQ